MKISHIITSIKEKFRLAKTFIRNIWVFRRTLANYQRWDYAGMLYAIRDASDDMRAYGMPYVKENKIIVKDLAIVSELCSRLICCDSYKFTYEMSTDEDGFIKITAKPIYDFPRSTKHSSSIDNQNENFDMLMHLMKRRMRRWWD